VAAHDDHDLSQEHAISPTRPSKSMRDTSWTQVRRRGFWWLVAFGKQTARDRDAQLLRCRLVLLSRIGSQIPAIQQERQARRRS